MSLCTTDEAAAILNIPEHHVDAYVIRHRLKQYEDGSEKKLVREQVEQLKSDLQAQESHNRMLQRGHWRDLFSHWSPRASVGEDLATVDAVIAHEFGDQQNISRTTNNIVRLADIICTKYKKPLICQYPGNNVFALCSKPVLVISKHTLRPGAYLDTQEVNRQAAEFCKERNWKKVALCTHPHHFWRASKNLEHHDLEPVSPDVSEIMYDEYCLRPGLRSAFRYMPREIFARGWYLFKGWI